MIFEQFHSRRCVIGEWGSAVKPLEVGDCDCLPQAQAARILRGGAVNTYAIIDDGIIVATNRFHFEESAMGWHKGLATLGQTLVCMDLGDGEVADIGDRVSVDDDGWACIV
jgi:hypothetical protein